ncbi:MAG: fused response regulator/phosphatase [Alphaproteobacteria bacterium]|nr:fused response regulator/phosphatase [Alphaproteobacteria bacterium]
MHTICPINEERLHSSCILIVEDEAMSRKLLVHSLQAQGYTNILTAENGSQALALTQEHCPDLVILDIMMPTMDGFAYCRAVRADAAFNNMPILVQTALDAMDKKLEAFKLGATDYICKPIDAGELAARTRVHLLQKLLAQDLNEYRIQMQLEMEAAKLMQSRIMPTKKQVQMCERIFDIGIGHHFEPSSDLGGDFWGVRPISDKRLALYMLDFSGHGVSAAMNVFRIHTVMQECAYAAGDPATFLTTLNRHLHPLLHRDEFATMFYGIIDTEANCLLYATAAMHPTLIFSKATEAPQLLDGRGFALGAIENATYETKFAPFMRGDVLLMYSDCLIESADANGVCIDESAISKIVRQVAETAPQHLAQSVVDSVVSALQTHQTATTLRDDLTVCAYVRN